MQFPVVVYQDEDGMFVGEIPTLKGCGSSAKTLEKLYENLQDAVDLYLSVEKEVPMLHNYSFHILSCNATAENNQAKKSYQIS